MFKNFSQRIESIKKIEAHRKDPIRFHIKYLDDALDGISRDDLIILTGKTGFGKTQLAAHIASHAACAGYKVHFFALEAHAHEIEQRIRFKNLASSFYAKRPAGSLNELPDYQSWILGKQDHLLKEFEQQADPFLSKTLNNLKTFYTQKPFNCDSFEAQLTQIGDETDLIIVDHLHYFDLPGSNENLEMKKTVKSLKSIVQFYRKPVLLLCQLRKSDKFNSPLLPGIDDLMGSSDIAKIATRIIVTGAAKNEVASKTTHFPTLIRVLKNRLGGDRTHFVALTTYNSSTNEYLDEYKLGKLTKNDTEFIQDEIWNYPWWARR